MSNKIALDALTKFVKNAEQSVFEDWLEAKSPSGDVEQVQIQWEGSSEYREFYEFCERAWAVPLSAAIAALEAMEAGGWLPIASAPKDGRAVLLYGAWAGEITGVTDIRGIEIGYWSDGESDFPGDDWWRLSGGDAYSCWIRPTHWMPLPTPPKD